MATSDVLTASYFCDLLGISTVETNSIRKSNSLEGEIEEYGQRNISTLKRNLLNKDEILRIPTSKLLAIIRGNKPLILDKVIYTEHPLSKKLKDAPILEYNPKWTKNTPIKVTENRITKENKNNKKKEKLEWNNF